MDADEWKFFIANGKRWVARMNEIHAALSAPMTDDEFYGLTVELCEIRDRLDGYYLPRGKEGISDG